MANFFKTFARGVLYVLVLPVLLLGLAIYAVFSLLAFIVIGIKAIILFFKGENMFGELEEDKEAKRRLDIMNLGNSNPLPPNAQPGNNPQNNFAPLKEPLENETFTFEHENNVPVHEDHIKVQPVPNSIITGEEEVKKEPEIDKQEIHEIKINEEVIVAPKEEKKDSFLLDEPSNNSNDDGSGVDITYEEGKEKKR
ncbi:hypothetical protein SDC9_100176 [bioreactor metagenome]|uniref:Uncharacterized protein n=1 Tax=bioreactor metagenome TaxID=1076179 RepID=A0A645AKZ0_9ZZZZ|nr:hypothetical protein [Erysipelotrichaceae bacterium]